MENQIPMNLVMHSTLLQSYVRSDLPRPSPPLFTTGHVNIVCLQPQPQPQQQLHYEFRIYPMGNPVSRGIVDC
jgi:hypothetical protein